MSMVLAMICWFLPITSLISPATLGVHLSPAKEHMLKRVPRVDFSSANFARPVSTVMSNVSLGGDLWATSYGGPTSETQRIVNSVATQGTILSIEPPAVNSSWSMDFHGPALVCNHVNDTFVDFITRNVAQATKNARTYLNGGEGFFNPNYRYISWVSESNDLIGSAPFQPSQANETRAWELRSSKIGPKNLDSHGQSTVDLNPRVPFSEGPPLSVFVAIFPPAMGYNDSDGVAKRQKSDSQHSKILRCSLHNASYQASFTSVNGDQTVDVTDRKILNDISYIDSVSNSDWMDMKMSYSNVSFIHNPRIIETLSYQSIMDAFNGVLRGSIFTVTFLALDPKDTHIPTLTGLKTNTTIVSTKLMDTEEMSIIQYSGGPGFKSPFQDYWTGRSVRSSGSSSLPLIEALEELFQNITISFMASQMFQPNYTVNNIPETNVTVTSYHNIYVYSRSVLWAAYGTALGVTLLTVVAGILVYFSNGGSYSTKFSTIFRITQGAIVSTDLGAKDYSGLEPTPDHIANAKMTILDDGRRQGTT
ncbi:unnamed protein product [Penicillium olsonii]|nr:unnamed protein product [Penicillium olsonii]CAG7930175.1 unnamed protein product [Penicillium olsonii]